MIRDDTTVVSLTSNIGRAELVYELYKSDE